MTRLPSLTICGMALKLFFNKTICEALLAASLPEAIAIEQSAAYTAGTLDVYFKPVGLDNFQRYYTDGGVALSINMNAPRALVLENFAISGIQLVPANIAVGDTAKTYNVSIVSLADQATVYTEVV